VVAVNTVQHRSHDRFGQSRSAGLLRLRLRRLWSRLYDPFGRILKSRRTRRRRRGVDVRRTWGRSRPLVRVIKIVSVAGGVVLLAAVAKALYVVILGKPSSLLSVNVDTACRNTTFSCDLLAGTLGPLFSLAFASALFLLVRLWFVRRPYVRKAREEPQLVVETAGSMIGEVVGRDRLCDVIIEDLRDRDTRRPHVVIGGVGTGKTALLVRLTKLLAERGAVPVPVRLRDAQDHLDFRELAQKRFIADSYGAFQSDAEGERVWRQLCRNDRVVVLADGLEEALIDGAVAKERDSFIRLAIRQASERRLPLIIASRPHDPLRETQAAIVELEPLGEEAALQYLQRGRSGEDERRLDWVVETADVTENPLYLQITRQLQLAGLMDYVTSRQDSRHLDTRNVDRAELRLRLLKTWMEALVDGHLATGVPLSREDRKATVEQLSVLACIGLQRDRLQVRFDDFETLRKLDPPPRIIVEVERALGELKRRCDIRLAATWGTQLGLVEAYGNGVRFPHSIIQAYLGSRLIDVAMADQQYRSKALKEPGRELLIAMVMNSRTKTQKPRPNEPAQARNRTTDPGADLRLRDLLHEKAIQHNDVTALYLHAAALQIDCVDQAPAHGIIANEIARCWPDLWAQDQRSLDEAKLNLVRCFGEAARTVAERRRIEPDCPAEPAYRQLYRIAVFESSYPIRVEDVQEIGAGGDDAFDALKGVLGPADDGDPADGQSSPRASRAGNGSSEPEPPTGRQAREGDQEEREWREKVIRAWLAPLLVGSVSTNARDARKNLEHWQQFVSERDSDRVEPGLRLSLQVALAQGFKYAANRRGRHPHANPETRAFLVEQAREMLRNSHFWFSRLTLVHALCLWSLTDSAAPQFAGRRSADHSTLVEHWVAFPGGQTEHPFVVEARKLAVWALETGQPERFIWIDESGVVAKIGSRPASPGSPRKHNLWIPPSTGWTALHPRAQKLVADVLLLLNLAERGAQPSDRNRRLERTNRNDLPPCLAADRSPLDPTRTVGMAATSDPGSNCKRGCPFELCPYPPKGEQSYRIELSEAFCRRQHALMASGSIRRRTAPWQEALPGDLKQFWKQMGHRALPSEIDRERIAERAGRRIRRTS
jgi:hypothetical protein